MTNEAATKIKLIRTEDGFKSADGRFTVRRFTEHRRFGISDRIVGYELRGHKLVNGFYERLTDVRGAIATLIEENFI